MRKVRGVSYFGKPIEKGDIIRRGDAYYRITSAGARQYSGIRTYKVGGEWLP